jgi:hypothetical protein
VKGSVGQGGVQVVGILELFEDGAFPTLQRSPIGMEHSVGGRAIGQAGDRLRRLMSSRKQDVD